MRLSQTTPVFVMWFLELGFKTVARSKRFSLNWFRLGSSQTKTSQLKDRNSVSAGTIEASPSSPWPSHKPRACK